MKVLDSNSEYLMPAFIRKHLMTQTWSFVWDTKHHESSLDLIAQYTDTNGKWYSSIVTLSFWICEPLLPPNPVYFTELKPGNSLTALSYLLHTPWRDSQWIYETRVEKSNNVNNPVSHSQKFTVCSAVAEAQIQQRSNYDSGEKWKHLHLKKKNWLALF